MTVRFIGTLVGALVGTLGMLIAVYLAGAGHGTYVPAVALFPVPMITTLLTGSVISPLAIALAFIQFPVYGFIVASGPAGRHTRALLTLTLVHVLCVIGGVTALSGGAFL
ncbi:MAG TPA: hypothetical protein VF701_08545 [Thermoanaerobaculia bacterium]